MRKARAQVAERARRRACVGARNNTGPHSPTTDTHRARTRAGTLTSAGGAGVRGRSHRNRAGARGRQPPKGVAGAKPPWGPGAKPPPGAAQPAPPAEGRTLPARPGVGGSIVTSTLFYVREGFAPLRAGRRNEGGPPAPKAAGGRWSGGVLREGAPR